MLAFRISLLSMPSELWHAGEAPKFSSETRTMLAPYQNMVVRKLEVAKHSSGQVDTLKKHSKDCRIPRSFSL